MLSIKIEGLEKLEQAFIKAPQEMAKDIQLAVRDAGELIAAQEVKEAPSATSNLRGSIKSNLYEMRAEVYPTAKYAPYVNSGTGLFGPKKAMIYPKNAKALAFRSGGKMIFAKAVRGQQPNPFVKRTVDAVGDKVNQLFKKVIDKAINILAGK